MPANLYKSYDSQGPVNAAAIRYPPTSGISAPANVFPDQADSGIVIPLGLNTYNPRSTKTQLSTIDLMPILNPNSSGFSIGGKTLGYGTKELPKLQLEGRIDTPCSNSIVNGEVLNIPDCKFNGMNVTYADLITAFLEGRANLQTTNLGGVSINNMWTRLNPTWFRDPQGRVYNDPKIISFTASYVEAVPGRVTFSMTLQVQTHDY